MALNNLPEAGRHYDEAARLYGELDDLAGQAAAAEGHGLLLLRLDQPASGPIRSSPVRSISEDDRAISGARQ